MIERPLLNSEQRCLLSKYNSTGAMIWPDFNRENLDYRCAAHFVPGWLSADGTGGGKHAILLLLPSPGALRGAFLPVKLFLPAGEELFLAGWTSTGGAWFSSQQAAGACQ